MMHTQLICLTGLGGDSIYNRFDNIYVLNLITASLRKGLQYLKAEHKRGKEPDELITARIEVGEQMEMLLLNQFNNPKRNSNYLSFFLSCFEYS